MPPVKSNDTDEGNRLSQPDSSSNSNSTPNSNGHFPPVSSLSNSENHSDTTANSTNGHSNESSALTLSDDWTEMQSTEQEHSSSTSEDESDSLPHQRGYAPLSQERDPSPSAAWRRLPSGGWVASSSATASSGTTSGVTGTTCLPAATPNGSAPRGERSGASEDAVAPAARPLPLRFSQLSEEQLASLDTDSLVRMALARIERSEQTNFQWSPTARLSSASSRGAATSSAAAAAAAADASRAQPPVRAPQQTKWSLPVRIAPAAPDSSGGTIPLSTSVPNRGLEQYSFTSHRIECSNRLFAASAAEIRELMRGVQLPPQSTPEWAARFSDQQLLERVRSANAHRASEEPSAASDSFSSPTSRPL